MNCYSTLVFQKEGRTYDDFVERCYFLEDKWTDILDETAVKSRKKRLQQQALWEFFVTERNYIKKLRVIVEVQTDVFYIYILDDTIAMYDFLIIVSGSKSLEVSSGIINLSYHSLCAHWQWVYRVSFSTVAMKLSFPLVMKPLRSLLQK